MSEALREFILYNACAIALYPDAISVADAPSDAPGRRQRRDTDEIQYFVINCHPDDGGRIIGRDGATINAIRRLATVIAQHTGNAANITVNTAPTSTAET